MTTYAAVFTFDSQKKGDIALTKVAKPPVVYYKITPSYYKQERGKRTWTLADPECPGDPPIFKKTKDTLAFYFIDSSDHVRAVGVVIEFQQAIGPFDDEVAAELRMAGPPLAEFTTELDTKWAFKLAPADGEGYTFGSLGKYRYTVAMISFPKEGSEGEQRKYFLDPEMDVDPS